MTRSDVPSFRPPPFRLFRQLLVAGIVLASAPVTAADERNLAQLTGAVPELKAGLTAAEGRIAELERALADALLRIRDLETRPAATEVRVGRIEEMLNEFVVRIWRLEAGNPEWIEKIEAEEREFRREIEEFRKRLLAAPPGKTMNELWRVGER